MSIQQMQEHIIKQVGNVKDENILRMLDEELSFYLDHKNDAASQLSAEDYDELCQLAAEPAHKDTFSFDEFKSMAEKWRTG
jgi:hypothetical protein